MGVFRGVGQRGQPPPPLTPSNLNYEYPPVYVHGLVQLISCLLGVKNGTYLWQKLRLRKMKNVYRGNKSWFKIFFIVTRTQDKNYPLFPFFWMIVYCFPFQVDGPKTKDVLMSNSSRLRSSIFFVLFFFMHKHYMYTV